MSFATTRYIHSTTTRVPVLTPLYGAHHAAFRAMNDGCYECGSSENCDFLLNFPGAKPAHCRFRREVESFTVNRLDGRVWVNDLPVSGTCELSEGDIVSFGPVSFRLDLHDVSTSFHEPADELFTSPRIPTTFVQQCSPRWTNTSHEIPAPAPASPVPDPPVSTVLLNEIQEHQRLLALRQQQLDELTQVVRERERQAESRLDAAEARAAQLTAQSDDLASVRERLSAREREVGLRSEEIDRQRELLAEQQRQLAA
ncbi:MAG: FHA domain-containing protein, partial [Planctomycetaceae bacterium]|nr:FHA domain-containing protein [Planctomycetaceae bacterium]